MRVDVLNFKIFLSLYILIERLHALYEDQAGLFDWRQQHVGRARFIEYIQGSHSGLRIIVSTEQNVVAAINGKNGQIGWRHILEKGFAGHIDDMKVSGSYVIVALSGGSYVRCFNSISGSLLWESTVSMTTASVATQSSHRAQLLLLGSDQLAVLTHDRLTVLDLETGTEAWNVSLPDSNADRIDITRADDTFYLIGRTYNSHVSVWALSRSSGALLSTSQALASWITADHKCSCIGGIYFVCADMSTSAVRVLPLAEVTGSSFLTVKLPAEAKLDYRELDFYNLQLSSDHVSVGGVVIALHISAVDSVLIVLDVHGGSVKLMRHLPGVSAVQVVSYSSEWVAVTVSRLPGTGAVSIAGFNLATSASVTDLTHVIPFPAHHGQPLQAYIGLQKGRENSASFSVLVLSEDHSLTLLEQPPSPHTGKLMWSREEALSSILSVELVDLPVSQIMAKMEDEFGAREDNIWNLFVKRFTTQFSQLVTFILQLEHKLRAPRHPFPEKMDDAGISQDIEQLSRNFDEDYLTRDEFNLHKIIIVVTVPGKIYGLDSMTGGIIWRNLLPNVEPFRRVAIQQEEFTMPLYVQRTTAHFPHQPLCTVLCRDKRSGFAMLYTFHPITGNTVSGVPPVGEVLNFNVISAVMLSHMDDQFMKPLLLLDTQKQYHVYPFSDTELVRSLASTLFTFVTDVESGIITGYGLSPSQMLAEPLWTLDTGRSQQTITNVVAKRAIEHVHSQGIVLEDRSVLYKYLNPNLVAIIAEGEDSQQKAFLNVYLVDAVTGNVVFHCTHKRSKGPVSLVHSENWIVYNFWNQKNRRVELAVLELYEGSRQSNSTAFSSFHPPPPPIVMRQAYIFPSHISTIATTVTEKGITSKELLFALETGGILGLPKLIIDPRRPEVMSPEAREEGLVPYVPELPRPYDRIINYNQSVFNIRGIHTAPAGLESTSLVLCYGLDVFFTRVMPSKMFDVLKEDFDYFFISSVLVGMIAVSFISQKLASRKALTRSWK